MALTLKWVAGESIASALTTELNSLANGSFSTASSAIANGTDLYQWISVELVLASLSPTAGAAVQIYIEYTLDATNYADHAKSLQTSSLLAGLSLDTTATTAQRIAGGPYMILPFDFKLSLLNQAGVALGATANTLKYRRSYEQAV